MMNSSIRSLLVVLLLASAIFLSACSGGGGDTANVDVSTPFIGGKNGLLASFIAGAPPEEVFDNNNFPFGISIQLKNQGEADVAPDQAYVEIVGINPTDFGVPSQEYLIRNLPIELLGAKKNFDGSVINGGQALVEFPEGPDVGIDTLSYVPDLHGNIPVNMRADICYDYKTRTTTKICVKRDLLETGRAELCKVSEEKTTYNSGGPIHITQLREDPIGTNKIQVNFVVSHVGDQNDAFFNVDSAECQDTITNPDRFVVKVIPTSMIAGVAPECSGLEETFTTSDGITGGYIHLFDGAPRPVICTIDISGVETTFEHLFEVDLEYKYLQSIQKTVLVKDVGIGASS
ncbi:hypothetical protein HYU19_02395 [Candidatus Woesearchaeota archaeon]|nr:hypothetical protein [Candidatus Woesearchaeota archaeon]